MRSQSPSDLVRTIGLVRRRYRLRLALRGVAVVGGAALVILLLSAFGLERLRYDPWAVTAFRTLGYLTLAALFVRFLVMPLLSRVSDERVALYIEEGNPSLDATLVSAVEAPSRAARNGEQVSPHLADRLLERAIERCRDLDYGRSLERPRLQRLSAVVAGLAGAAALAVLLSPPFVRQAAPFLIAPWSVRAASPYSIEVTPGNTTIARGADLEIKARLVGFDADSVELVTGSAATSWKRSLMTAEARGLRAVLLDLREGTEYFVEASGVRSPVFRVEVADLPYVKRIDLEYHFPAYTGLPPQVVEDGGDIAVLKGTEVRLKVTPTMAVKSGRLALEGLAPVALQPAPDGTLTAILRVEKDGFYKVELPGRDGSLLKSSPDYAIDALLDQPPTVSFTKPGRDTKATPIEEVFAEAKSEDDYGVSRLDLVYSVNGGEEKTVALHQGTARKMVSAGHTFFLEEMELKPGEFISYYARAVDAGNPAQAATTDIYFLEARPFRRDYRQADQRGGGGGGGGGGPQNGALSQQQRQIIAATFKLARDREKTAEKEWGEDLKTVGLMQGRLREQVDQLVARMVSRGVLDSGDMQETAGALKKAVAEMRTAEEGLGKQKPRESLPPEQRALAELQRAEESFRDVRVSFEMGQGGGGGGEGARAEDLADLFELELDKLRNQYETVQRGQQERTDEKIDEALQRLQELARRQEQENERRRQMAGRLPNQSGGGGGGQQQLADEAEELGRRLERLAREKPSPALEDTARRLRDAANAMRRQAAGNRGGTPAEGASALDRLNEARRLLEKNRRGRLDRDMQEAQRKAEELSAAQRKIASEVKDARAQGGAGSGERMPRIEQRKDALAEGVGELESQLERMARDARAEQKEAARRLQQSAEQIRDSKLKEKIRYSKGTARQGAGEESERMESEIAKDLDALGRRIGEASGAMGTTGEQRLAQTLDRTQELARSLESLSDRLKDRARNASRDGKGDPQRDAQAGRRPGQQGGKEAGESGQGERGSQSAQNDGSRRDGSNGQSESNRQNGSQGQNNSEGQPGSNQGGSNRQGSDVNGGSNFGAPWGGGQPRMSAEDVRQIQRELRQRLGDARDLGRELQRMGRPAGEVQSILRRLDTIDQATNFGRALDPLGLAELTAAVAQDLKVLEYGLRRQAEGGDKPKLQLSGSDEVPAGWRTLVEEYYRSLARKGAK